MRSPADRRRFVRLPWAANRGNPCFVPPLIAQETILVDPERHPFYRDGAGRFFLAERNGRAVGRIAAIRNPPYERFWNDPCGFFGFYENTEKGEAGLETTRALLDAVRNVMSEWNLPHFIGPANPSSNYTFGVLLEGFDRPPRVMMPYNPPEYDGMLTAAGLTKARDLLAFELRESDNFDRIRKIAARAESRHGIKIRTVNMKKFQDEVEIMKDIYNDVWKNNWGFSPMSSEEFWHMAREMKDLIDSDLVLIAEINDRPVAFSLFLPDIFEALVHLNGRIFTPWAFVKLMFYTYVWPKIRSGRVLALGVREEFQHLAIGTIMYIRSFDVARKKGYRSAEASWILEDNRQMIQALEAMNSTCYKKYRVYRGETHP